MRVDSKLLLLSLINFLGSLVFFYFLNENKSENDLFLNAALGWIFWLGIFVIVFPNLIKDEVKRQWFSDEYRWATFIIFFLNIFIPWLTNVIAFKLPII